MLVWNFRRSQSFTWSLNSDGAELLAVAPRALDSGRVEIFASTWTVFPSARVPRGPRPGRRPGLLRLNPVTHQIHHQICFLRPQKHPCLRSQTLIHESITSHLDYRSPRYPKPVQGFAGHLGPPPALGPGQVSNKILLLICKSLRVLTPQCPSDLQPSVTSIQNHCTDYSVDDWVILLGLGWDSVRGFGRDRDLFWG